MAFYYHSAVDKRIALLFATFRGYPEGIGHLWSIGTEMRFYLIAPLIAYVMLRIAKNKACAALALFITCGLYLVYYWHLNQISFAKPSVIAMTYWWKHIYIPLKTNLIVFIVGMSVNLFLKDTAPLPRQKLRCAMLVALPSLYVLACFLADGNALFMQYQTYYQTTLIITPLLTALVTAGIIYLIEKGNEPRKPLTLQNIRKNPWRMIEICGVLSYGCYVWQFVVIDIYAHWASPQTATGFIGHFILLYACLLLVSGISYVLIELPFSKIKLQKKPVQVCV